MVIKKEADKDDIMTLAQDILEKAHPDAVTVIQSLCHVIQSRWEEVMTWASQVLLFFLFFFIWGFLIYLSIFLITA